MTPTVSVLMVSYRTRELTVRALSALRDSCPGTTFETIVVDNASGDGSAAAIRGAFPAATVEELPENVGFGRAMNRAARHARGDWLLLVNPDTEPEGDVVSALVAYATAHPEHGIYTGRTLHADGTDDMRSCFALPTLRQYLAFALGLSTLGRRFRRLGPVFNPEELPGYDRTTAREVPAVSGCLMLVRRDLFTALDGFTPDYFMYSEDIDLCVRAREHGARPVLVPEARLRHLGGASAGTSSRKIVMLLRGKCTFVRLRWTPARAATARTLIAAGVGLRGGLAALLRRKSPWREVWRARRVWLAGWPAPAPAPAPVIKAPSTSF
ncbi:glycosyltransferase family 2 protein [Phytohabitans sp. ZYX-F-186]|uniref:Glycosyltransferase family 2 protein n=1 Tax=Phytohabitans maris TaxID=3071409 RepID=A0ABU0ZUM2_9ACTN|nr:glycosyltransferase family 2 protein [Phytohabitans sp. ZYX-F-186]MDQ7909622.1 glycosyltransferase family 2 protein [Phytohabitans sp. ZYX-F-186]